jgi:uncharacterized damage-inducible protein DinB
MKEILTDLAFYNIWANQLLLDTLINCRRKTKQELPSSFKSLYKTVLHMLDAESIWWQRMKLLERITRISDDFNGDMKELSNNFLQQNRHGANG